MKTMTRTFYNETMDQLRLNENLSRMVSDKENDIIISIRSLGWVPQTEIDIYASIKKTVERSTLTPSLKDILTVRMSAMMALFSEHCIK